MKTLDNNFKERKFPNERRKRLKPRRKFQKKGMKRHYVIDPDTGTAHDATGAKVKIDSIDYTMFNAREQAMVWRKLIPRCEIHIRRGFRVVIKPHNSEDCLTAIWFSNKVNQLKCENESDSFSHSDTNNNK